MRFLDLLSGAEILAQSGNPEISGIEYDSRRLKPGYVFVALRGGSTDGNQFIREAIAQGAVAVVTDSNQVPEATAWARVAQGRRALARMSANYYGRPAERLRITGITGTNGKTTTAFLLESILQAAGRKTALIGTIEYHIPGKSLPALHTTPEALELNRLFSQALEARVTDAAIEVSSHALVKQRTFGIPFDVAVFTNLTRDHLDYHKTIDEYFAAKRILFSRAGASPPRVAVLNADDEHGRKLQSFARDEGSEVIAYGIDKADFHAANLQFGDWQTRFDLLAPAGSIPVRSSLVGRVNVENILAASAAAYAGGCSLEAIAGGVGNLVRVPGRFERVECGQPFTVVVDYAHTDDALRNLTRLARDQVSESGGRVITLFGCGGDRDWTKRPLMGEAAGRGSDFVVLTSDNPRTEDPWVIIQGALEGLKATGTEYRAETDRRTAIHLALGEARPGDIVLLAGKGHERRQVVAGAELVFDDREVAAEALRRLGYDCSRIETTP